MKTHTLLFRSADRNIFNLIRTGKKKVETRAGGPKYSHLAVGDLLMFICGASKFKRRIVSIRHFKTISGLLRAYTIKDVHPGVSSGKELSAKYASFPGYTQRIKKFGLMAIGLK